MGNQPPKQNQIHKCQLNHPLLSAANLIRQQESLQLELILPVGDKKIIQQWQAKVDKYRIPELEGQVLFLPKVIKFEQEAFCGSTGFAKVRYSAPPLLLSQEVQNRIKIMQLFTQQQIWYLLYVLTYAADQLHTRSLFVGDIRPKNIFLFADGNVSVACLASFPDQLTNYLKSLQYKQKTFLSPEQLQDLKKQKADCQNPNTSESFSIGLTILGLMLLHDEQVLYLEEGLSFEEGLRKQILNLANCSFYTQHLRRIVIGLLIENIQQRLSSAEIARILKPYEEKIINLQTFSIEPQNLKQITKFNNVRLSDYRKPKLQMFQPVMLNFSFGQKYPKPLQIPTPMQQKFSTFGERNQKSGSNTLQNINSSKETKFPDSHIQFQKNSQQNKGSRSVNISKNEFQTKSQTEKQATEQHYLDSKSDVGCYQQNSEFPGENYKKTNGYTYVQPIHYKNKYLQISPTQPNFVNKGQTFSLEEMGRQTKSIVKGVQEKKQYSGNKKQYESVLKHIDEQLQRSRELFPNRS